MDINIKRKKNHLRYAVGVVMLEAANNAHALF